MARHLGRDFVPCQIQLIQSPIFHEKLLEAGLFARQFFYFAAEITTTASFRRGIV